MATTLGLNIIEYWTERLSALIMETMMQLDIKRIGEFLCLVGIANKLNRLSD